MANELGHRTYKQVTYNVLVGYLYIWVFFKPKGTHKNGWFSTINENKLHDGRGYPTLRNTGVYIYIYIHVILCNTGISTTRG